MKKKISALAIQNAEQPANLYKSIPCTVGFSYIRFEVDGTVRPCCISKYPIGKVSDATSWKKVWRSAAYQVFREKMFKINEELFHLNDPEFLFCQQCSHRPINKWNFERLKKSE